MVVCPQCGEENPDRAKFCSECATPWRRLQLSSGVSGGWCRCYSRTLSGSRAGLRALMWRMGRVLQSALHDSIERCANNPVSPLAPDLFRFGVAYADGRAARSTDLIDPDLAMDAASHLGIRAMGGIGADTYWQLWWWVATAPPTGPVRFTCEWPSQMIAATWTDIPADRITSAAARATILW